MYFFNIYAANITNEMLFTCFFDELMLNIVCVFGLFGFGFFTFMGQFFVLF